MAMRGVPRNRFRIPIAAIMAIIALIAVEIGLLRVASDNYVDLSRLLTVVMLAVATCLARYRQGDRAAWWFGFALLGWAYFALLVDVTARQGAGLGRLTLPKPAVPHLTFLDLFSDASANPNGLTPRALVWNRYEILQSIVTLVIACLGGLASLMLARRRGEPYHEVERRAGRLELGDEPEHPVVPPLTPS
jgi:hypothetical protein